MNPIEQACRLLREGRLVAFPTETVYGLGADATNVAAVERIFLAKGRPATNPVIVHIADIRAARRYATVWPEAAETLAAHFWPGPLTLVLPRKETIAPLVSAGGATVGLRVPNHPLALQLLREFDGPIAAPSANRSNHISPTQAEHVRQELGEAVDLVLDGGACAIGIESTVLDLSTHQPTILRPGGVTREQIESLIGPIDIFEGSVQPTQAASSPGQQERHYSPLTAAYGFESSQRIQLIEILRAAQRHSVAVMTIGTGFDSGVEKTEMPTEPEAYAARMYATLRQLDEKGYAAIYIELPPATGQWLAVRDRLQRASRPI
jgi:L-threonylcarbamoyladenylate synthase